MKEKDYKKYLVVSKNEAMRAKWPYTELEQKISALIIAVVNPKDKDFKEYTFKTAQILKLFNMGSKNYENLYRVTEGLLKNPISIQKDDGKLYQSNIIADAEYNQERSEVKFTIAPKMRGYLLELQKGEYTKFYLENIIGLNSRYSIAMYRFCKSFEAQKIIVKTIEEMKFVLGIEDHEYKNFYDFNKWVLLVSQKELEEKTDIRFNYKTEKFKNKVAKLHFTINWNPNLEDKLNITLQKKILAEMDVKEYEEKAKQVRKQLQESLFKKNK